MFRTITALSVATFLFAAGCADEGVDQDYVVNTDTLQVNKTGNQLDATFTGAAVKITATAQRAANGTVQVTLVVGAGSIAMTVDPAAGVADVTGSLDMEEDGAAALSAFAQAFFAYMPDRAGIADRVYRMAALYAKHPVGAPVEARRIQSNNELRGWTSLCSSIGQPFTGRFDYECNCSWGFCDSCRGAWSSTIGGNNGNNGCFGVCGAGCGGGTDYTVDCANHDACANAGKSSYQCSDEWASASDDFLFAPSC